MAQGERGSALMPQKPAVSCIQVSELAREPLSEFYRISPPGPAQVITKVVGVWAIVARIFVLLLRSEILALSEECLGAEVDSSLKIVDRNQPSIVDSAMREGQEDVRCVGRGGVVDRGEGQGGSDVCAENGYLRVGDPGSDNRG